MNKCQYQVELIAISAVMTEACRAIAQEPSKDVVEVSHHGRASLRDLIKAPTR